MNEFWLWFIRPFAELLGTLFFILLAVAVFAIFACIAKIKREP
jgi:hypothetical protein